MRIVVLGAGGVGGYFGGRLVEAGADVTFIVRERRKLQLDANGLVLDSPLGSTRLAVRSVTSPAGIAPADLVILTPKAYDLGSALEAIAPVVGPGTAVMPLLNGVAHLDQIAARFPQAVAWGGVAHIAATLASDGTVRHLNTLNRLLFGARYPGPAGSATQSGSSDARVSALAGLLAKTPVEADARTSIEQDLWDKLVFLAVLAGATCLFRSSIGAILSTAEGPGFMSAMLAECGAVAAAEGFSPHEQALQRYAAELNRAGSTLTSSMLRDIENGNPTERAHILGDLLARAGRRGLRAPTLALADSVIAAYENARHARLSAPG